MLLSREIPAQPDDQDLIDAGTAITAAERHSQVLEELAQIGLDMARMLKLALDESLAQSDKSDAVQIGALCGVAATAFAKVSQAIRRTVALEGQVLSGIEPKRRVLIAEARKREPGPVERFNKVQSAISIAVGEAIEDKFGSDNTKLFEALNADMETLLDIGDEFDGFVDRPIGETVAQICKVLGLDPEWSRWDGKQWVMKKASWRPPLCRYVTPWPGKPKQVAKPDAAVSPKAAPPH